jgi:hypothetical protein
MSCNGGKVIVYSDWQYILHGVNIKIPTDIKNDRIAILQKRINKKIISRGTKLKISQANKGQVTWNKGKKLHYIPGKREYSEETLNKMRQAAKRRWAQYQ